MKKRHALSVAVTLTLLETATAYVYADESKLETVVIIGEREAPIVSSLVGSVDVISQEELSYEHVDDTLELFNKVPGVYLARYNQGIINTDIAIRGFAGDGVTLANKYLPWRKEHKDNLIARYI